MSADRGFSLVKKIIGSLLKFPKGIMCKRRDPLGGNDPLSFNATATHCAHPYRTPGGVPAGGSTYALTIDHVHTRTTCFADLCDHAIRLMKRCKRCGLRGCCDGQGKSDSDQPDHCFLHVIHSTRDFLEGCSDPRLPQRGAFLWPPLRTFEGLATPPANRASVLRLRSQAK